jgi:PASTA domain/Glucodextranase, domain B
MRPAVLAFLALSALLLAACGGSDEDEPKTPVRVVMTGPGDGAVVRDDEIELTGSVTPAGAVVTIAGEPVEVSAGGFSTRVPLDPGGNVVDVMASADGMAPAMTAVRVVRRLTVRVPDLGGESPDGARERLAAAGLRADVVTAGGLIEDFLPGDRAVCGTEPDAGSTVDSGSTVEVTVAKVC